jgi:hypothetical protein
VNGAIIAAAGISAFGLFLFLTEDDLLSQAHSSWRSRVLNLVRWSLVVLMSWALIPIAFVPAEPQRAATIIELCALIGTLMLLPVSWFVRLGGRDVKWELRKVKVEATRMANRVRAGGGPIPQARIREQLAVIQRLRAPATAEFCDLLTAELDDLRTGTESWNEAGRRAIRIDEISRQLWPEAVPPPDFDPEEATFRWRLYRTFGEMMEIGVTQLSPEARDEFQRLLASLEDYRRSDTETFIDEVRVSAARWLARAKPNRPWIGSYDFTDLGPDGLDKVKRIWGRDAALWGARLEPDDRRALAADLARRTSQTEPVPDPGPLPAQEPEQATAATGGAAH